MRRQASSYFSIFPPFLTPSPPRSTTPPPPPHTQLHHTHTFTTLLPPTYPHLYHTPNSTTSKSDRDQIRSQADDCSRNVTSNNQDEDVNSKQSTRTLACSLIRLFARSFIKFRFDHPSFRWIERYKRISKRHSTRLQVITLSKEVSLTSAIDFCFLFVYTVNYAFNDFVYDKILLSKNWFRCFFYHIVLDL